MQRYIIIVFLLAAGVFYSGSFVFGQKCISEDHIVQLPAKTKETSGLAQYKGYIYTHNDSGGDAAIYKINMKTGKLVEEIPLDGITNNDWEALTISGDYLFIGEFGNNNGNRTNLKIYKVNLANKAPIEVINFSYAEQSNFEKARYQHNFDCEALCTFGDSLWLFTKNWNDKQSRLYVLPQTAGTYKVVTRKQIKVDGLITGADYKDGLLVLCGYNDWESSLWLAKNIDAVDDIPLEMANIGLSCLAGSQTEGVSIIDNTQVFLSTEETPHTPNLLYTIDISRQKKKCPKAIYQPESNTIRFKTAIKQPVSIILESHKGHIIMDIDPNNIIHKGGWNIINDIKKPKDPCFLRIKSMEGKSCVLKISKEQ